MAVSTKITGALEFDLLKKYVAKLVGYNLLNSKDVGLIVRDNIEYLGKQMVLSWTDIGQKLVDDRYTAYWYHDVPRSWWQMLKQDKLPTWFTDRYPVQYSQHKHKRTIFFSRHATYPMANVNIDKQSKIFIQTLGGIERIEDNTYEY